METRRLGRVGHESSVLIYGGAMLSEIAPEEADRSIAFALESGINHFDTAAAYGDSELHLGRWVPRIRDRIFLATKTGDRTAIGAYDSVGRSLERLQTDRVDLIQLHSVGDPDDLDRATGTGGAVEGAVRAREAGLAGAIGITGHGVRAPATHLEALRRFPFDTVLTPYNFLLSKDDTYLRDFNALARKAGADDVGLMLIKALSRNLWKEDEVPRYTTWYEPLDERREIDAAVAFALRRPEITGICTAGDVNLLPMQVEAERKGGSFTIDELEEELSRIPDLGSPFLRAEGRVVPDWLEPLLPG
jgi:aryl-alcohol dehydrogenase-like predicted oxidoreductase